MNLISSIAYGKTLTDVIGERYRELRDNYDNLLIQNLQDSYKINGVMAHPLNRFVPCDLEGNVLMRPVIKNNHSDECQCSSCLIEYKDYERDFKQYQQAKDRVLFEGWYVESQNNISVNVTNDGKRFLNWMKKDNFFFMKSGKTIEYFVQFELTLTPSAIKLIGLK